MRVCTALSALGVVIASVVSAQDRELLTVTEGWPYERLVDESDEIVIGTFKSTRDAELVRQLDVDVPDKVRVAIKQVESEFTVHAVLKGKSEETIVLRHYTWKSSPPPGGGYDTFFAVFRSERDQVRGEGWTLNSQPHYMLFLRRLPGGTYAPVSGQAGTSKSVSRILNVQVN